MNVSSVSLTVLSYPVPLPAYRGPRSRKGQTQYPFDQLELGHAFTVFNRAASTLRVAIQRYYQVHGRGKLFVQRLDAAGNPTVWRVK